MESVWKGKKQLPIDLLEPCKLNHYSVQYANSKPFFLNNRDLESTPLILTRQKV